MKKKLTKFIVFIACFAAVAWGILVVYKIHEDRIAKNVNVYKTVEHALQSDTTLLENGRQYGDVNLQKFIELASRKPRSVFDPSQDVVCDGDSVTISTRTPSIFFGIDDGAWWRSKYKQLPISFPDDHSFKAALHTKAGEEYICIPFQILYSLAVSSNE